MREVKFRGKTKDGKWVEGSLVRCEHTYAPRIMHPKRSWIVTRAMSNGGWFTVCQRYPVIEDSVGQYVGRCDAKGKEIFEGDIIIYGGERYEVKYIEKYNRFAAVQPGIVFAVFDTAHTVVIGNMVDNPELMEVAE